MENDRPDNVVEFPTNDIEKTLRELHDRARRGEIAGLAVAAIGTDSYVYDSHCGYLGHRNILMKGLLQDLLHQINNVAR